MIYDGLTEECMGIDPDSIQGIWFSPIQAFQMNVSDRRTHSYQSVNWEWFEISAGDVNTTGNAYTYIYDAGTTQKTEDYEKWILVDPMGTTYATLPWGIPWSRLYLTVDVGASGAFLIVNALDDAMGSSSIGEGRTIKMPLISAPVTSNAFSSYVYSGQRDYDIRMAEIQQNAAA